MRDGQVLPITWRIGKPDNYVKIDSQETEHLWA